MNAVAYASAVPVEERDGERCVPHVYPLAELLAGNACLRAGAASMRERCARWLLEDAPQLTTDTALLDLLAERVRALPLTEEEAHVPGV